MEKGPGILTREDILAEVKLGLLIKHCKESNIHASSYDMRVGTVFDNGRRIKKETLKPQWLISKLFWQVASFFHKRSGIYLEPSSEGQIVLDPGAIISLFTHEELMLPNDVVATAFAMNSMSSQGVLVLNPGHVDPGYCGPLTVRIINLRATSKAIMLGDAIFTVIFERLPHATEKGYAHNIDREDAELKFAAMDLEQNPRSLFKLIESSKENTFLTGAEVDRRISQHWMGQAIFVFTSVAAIGSILAVIVALVSLYFNLYPKQEFSSNAQILAPTPPVRREVANPQGATIPAVKIAPTPTSGAADQKAQKK